MTSNQPDSSNPVFKTPQPSQLQSEEEREMVRQRLSEEQGSETDVVAEDEAKQDDNPTEAVNVIENMDNLADRHPPSINAPPG